MSFSDAMAYLEAHASYDVTGRITSPSLATITGLCEAMGEPQDAYPVIHVTGTNGKGSTVQMITRLLMANGLTVGTYTSPHLERVNERITRNCEPISDEELAEQISAVADMEMLTGLRPSYFEVLTAAAFRWFADVAVDVAVIEVGLLGRWDATNLVNSAVAVVTNIGLDHLEFAGPTRAHVATEKAGIIKATSAAVIGETDSDLLSIFVAENPASLILRDLDFGVGENALALGGRLVDLRTPTTVYPEVYLPLHGAHQGDNAAVALAAVETFFAAPLAGDVVQEGFAAVSMPGRFEILSVQPLIVVDGAHNPAGADTCAQVFFDDFEPEGRRILVIGTLRDPDEMLSSIRADEFDVVIVCTAPSPRGIDCRRVAQAARDLGCGEVIVIETVELACDYAVRNSDPDDAVLIAGSLYVAGAARPVIRRLTG
jgi:dihydrofolate synthase / folylpolyglutamate synthase